MLSAEEELARTLPAVAAVRAALGPRALLSVDTFYASVAAAAIAAGANMVNDVTGGRGDAAMAALVARTGVPYVCMHSRGGGGGGGESPDDVIARLTYRGVSVASLRSPSRSASGSASPSGTPSGSATGSCSATSTGSRSSTGTPSPTATPSPSATRTPSAPATRSAAASRSPSPTQPLCRGLPAITALSGTSGVAPPRSTVTSGQPAMYTAGSCATGLGAFYPGPRLLFALDLGSDTPLGGVLTLTTCGHTANNTVLYVGTGCPTWAQPFGCRAGNDNAAGPACGGNGLASTVAVAATQPTYYVQLGGFNGAAVTSGLGWAYAPPAAASGSAAGSATRSRSGSATRSRSGSRSRSRSGSRSGSRSRSRKAK